MADILSQEEIDALLSAGDGEGGQPVQPVQPVKWPVGEPEVGPEVGPAPASKGRGWSRAAAEVVQRFSALPEGVDAKSTHAYIFANERETAAVLRTILRQRQGGGEGLLSGLSHQEVAAAFVIGLGREVAAGVLRHLEREQVQEVAAAVIAMPEVDHRVATQALETVRQRIVAGNYVEVGGADYARSVLGDAVGAYRAGQIVDRVLHPSEEGFKLLEKVDTDALAPFISNEHPQTIAFILSQVKAGLAAGLLSKLPERLQPDVAYRLSTMDKVTAETMQRVEDVIGRVLRELLSGVHNVGGPKVAADMLNLTGSSVEKNVLDAFDAQDAKVAESVRNLMFVFADIGTMSDRDIQVLLSEVEQRDLTIALKAATEQVKDRILGNMSAEGRQSLTEEMEFLGPMRLSEVEEVQLNIVHKVRELEKQGQVTIVRGIPDDQFV